ncbi:type IV pili methyl-accepting chemotaxis transducer N-terminal domain-containing protein, partial [Burkholderiaceae bacterium DAT-1]|nr:type IV pili methyl-accepting chemotaxis transducer N-terminal domain-containing protein [Burkholderiaceae bacterium DAT-1]
MSMDDEIFIPQRRISTKIVSASLIALVIVLITIGGTLWLSWQLEGAGAAINDTGSLRMRATRIGLLLKSDRPDRESLVRINVALMDETLQRLEKGNPARPLFLPHEPAIQRGFASVKSDWYQHLRPAATSLAPYAQRVSAYDFALDPFVAGADELVRLIERDNATKTTWLRLSQAGLAFLAGVGTLAMIYLLYIWIILPIMHMQRGLARMAAHEFSARLPVES